MLCHSEAKPKNLGFPCLLFITLFTFASLSNGVASAAWEELAASATGGGVSNNVDNSFGPSLALDSNNNPHIAWQDNSGGDWEIYYAYWDGTSWVTHGGANTGGGVSNNAGDSFEPSLALDSSGNPHIAWWDSSSGDWEIYYAYWDGTSWVTHGGANTGGGVSNSAGDSREPSLALDSSNNPHIAWMDSSSGDYEIYYAYWDGTSWVTHGGANTGGGVSNNAGESAHPSLALDVSGNPHIAWEDNSSGGWEIYYAYWNGANWVTHGGANTGGGLSNTGDVSTSPSLALDSSNNPHIAWAYHTSGTWIYYAYWDGANWVTHGGANTGGGMSNTGGSQGASLALDSSGNPHIAWMDVSGGSWVIYYAYWDGTSWITHGGANTGGGLSNNAGDSRYPSLALDSSGNPHIAWWDNYEIYYRYWNPACPSLLPKICRTCPTVFSVRQGRTLCKSFRVWNCGKGTLNWTVSEGCNWLTLSPSSGTLARTKSKVVKACVDTTGLARGDYKECTVTITGDCASNSSQTCVIKLKVR